MLVIAILLFFILLFVSTPDKEKAELASDLGKGLFWIAVGLAVGYALFILAGLTVLAIGWHAVAWLLGLVCCVVCCVVAYRADQTENRTIAKEFKDLGRIGPVGQRRIELYVQEHKYTRDRAEAVVLRIAAEYATKSADNAAVVEAAQAIPPGYGL